jgi:hypothetical protein
VAITIDDFDRCRKKENGKGLRRAKKSSHGGGLCEIILLSIRCPSVHGGCSSGLQALIHEKFAFGWRSNMIQH